MIKFALPYNRDMDFIDRSLYVYGNYIESYFGNLGIDDFGGGRAQTQNIVKQENELKAILDKLNAAGIDFNYVINNNGLMNEEFTEKYQERYLRFINKLVDLGIRKVTLSNPYLIQYTKQKLPALKISASVNLKTRSWEELEYLIQLGIDEATLHYDLIKNFAELIRIRSKTDLLLKLIPNDLYISNCPGQKGHTRIQGSHSKHKETETPYFSYYRNKCVNIRNLKPEEIYSGKWIAPADIPKYMEIGYKNFELLDRMATTEWIMKSIQIYIEQSRTTHLEEILGTYGSKSNIHASVSEDPLEQTLYPSDQLKLIPGISQVENKLWYSADHTDNCTHCTLCQHAADQSLIYPEDKREQYIENNGGGSVS